MSTNVVSISNKMPAAFQAIVDDLGVNDDLSGGMGTGFSVVSIKGSRWRLKMGGESQVIMNPETGEVVPSIEVVLLKANPHYSKIWYAKNYTEGDDVAPDCMSTNGETPDAGCAAPQSETCVSCPHDVWGSKMNEETGAKGKECQDHRRVAVLFTSELNRNEDANVIGPALLRIPAASLKDLKLYGKGLSSQYGLPYMAVVTRLGFDPEVSFPKLTFKAARALTEEEAEIVVEQMSGEVTEGILTGSDIIGTSEPAPKPPAKEKPKPKEPAGTVDVTFDEVPSEPAVAPVTQKKEAAPEKAVETPAPVEAPAEEVADSSGVSDDISSIMGDLDNLDL